MLRLRYRPHGNGYVTGVLSRVQLNRSATSRRRGNRIAKRLIAVILAASLVFVLGGGWYFSGQIYSSGLAISADDGEAAPTTAADVVIGQIDDGTIAGPGNVRTS